MEVGTLACRREAENPLDSSRYGVAEARIARVNIHIERSPASNTKSSREETRTRKHTMGVSSTGSSPGYISRGLINPATYSFTEALKALQARPGNGWDYLSSINSLLNPKWNEAEKYICNPLSGQIPVECLSTKTLSGRALPISGRITKSGPLILSQTSLVEMRPNVLYGEDIDWTEAKEMVIKKKQSLSSTRDVGTQSSLPELSSSGSNSSLDWSTPYKDSSLTRCSSGASLSASENTNKIEHEVQGKANEKNQAREGRQEKKMRKWRSWGCLLRGLLQIRHRNRSNTCK